MAQATFSVRMDETLKKQLDEVCFEFGMTTSTAFNIFAKTVVRERKIPFEIRASNDSYSREGALKVMREMRESAIKNGIDNMSLDDINSEIDAARRNK